MVFLLKGGILVGRLAADTIQSSRQEKKDRLGHMKCS